MKVNLASTSCYAVATAVGCIMQLYHAMHIHLKCKISRDLEVGEIGLWEAANRGKMR